MMVATCKTCASLAELLESFIVVVKKTFCCMEDRKLSSANGSGPEWIRSFPLNNGLTVKGIRWAKRLKDLLWYSVVRVGLETLVYFSRRQRS